MLFIWLFHFACSYLHPIHVSVSEVEIHGNEVTWNARIYKDDLLLGMYGGNIDMRVLENPDKVRKDILTYFSKNVTLLHDGNKIKWLLEDVQPDPEAIWITVSSKLPDASSIAIQNRILFDVYNDQKNVVNIVWSNGRKNMVFEKGDEKKVIDFH